MLTSNSGLLHPLLFKFKDDKIDLEIVTFAPGMQQYVKGPIQGLSGQG